MPAMPLDRQQLARYIGDDRAFEVQFLTLLLETVKGCVVALEAPTPQIYSVLHAAKAGIAVAASAELNALHQLACDHTVDPGDGTWIEDDLALLKRLREHLIQFAAEIALAITPSAKQSAL
jgi:hypothetical protein